MLKLLLPVLFISISTYANEIKLVTDTWCPFACEKNSLKQGILIDVAKQVFQNHSYKVNYQTMPFSRALKDTMDGLAQGIVGIQNIPIRKQFIFPSVPQATSKVCFYGPSQSPWTYRKAEKMEGLRVGAVKDYSYGKEVDDFLTNSQAHIEVSYGNDALVKNIYKIKANHLDIIVEYEYVAQNLMHTDPKLRLKSLGCSTEVTELYIAFSPKDPQSTEYARILSEGTMMMIKNGKMKKILANYGVR
ncbi:MAG TPA: transporter substrate-binding domain-containing protein [Pseudobdellovibrionaceae bacterium]|nr:transporter substrate-binding domain-containing protein [Pseudobdellovibrionaceae bacterium]